MSNFCIDLEGMMLPDAIAAVVEAWYEAQNTHATSNDWVEELRLQIKREFGRGWIIRSHSPNRLNPNGRCQLTRIAPDRSRNSVVLQVEWCRQNAQQIKSQVYQLIDLYNQNGGNLQDCLSALDKLEAHVSMPVGVF
jgi:hypothetical protein